MSKSTVIRLSGILLLIKVSSICLSQTFPSIPDAPSREKLQEEAAKIRAAVGPWKQIAAIESQEKEGIGSNDPKIPDVMPNRHAVSFIGNEKLVIGDADHPVRIFDLTTGKLLSSFGDKLSEYWSDRQWIASSDGQLLLMVPDKSIRIWDINKSEIVATLPPFENEYQFARFLPGDKSIVVYRGVMNRGEGPDNLQVWDINRDAKNVTLRQSFTINNDARGMEIVGPYLLIRGYRHNQVLDVNTFQSLYRQDGRVDEEYLALVPPHSDQLGQLISLEYSHGEERWTEQEPQFRIVEIPSGKEIKRWKCPIEENKESSERYDSLYTLSPDQKTIAISRKGRVAFYDFLSGNKISTITANNIYDHCSIRFLDIERVLVGQQRWGEKLSICEVTTGKEIESIPESDYFPMVSDNGQYVIGNRDMMPIPGKKGWFLGIPHPLVVIWRRTTP